MRKLIIILTILISQLVVAQSGFRINHTEYFTAGVYLDPTASVKEKGLDVVAEIEYSGIVYAKAGFESFSVLTGGYKDIHYGMGINFTSGTFEKIRYYVGFRQAVVFRNGGSNANYGFEGGIDHDISDNFFIGLRATLDKRNDQEIMRWTAENKFSGFIRIGYKWYYKNRRP